MSRVTIVTGGSRGIGAATARLLVAAGHTVCIAYREAKDEAERVLKEAGGRGLCVQADTGAEADILRLFEAVDCELGAPTGLVNNAGIHGPRTRLDGMSASDIERVLMVNVLGPMICAREAVKRMSTRHGGKGGVIVNVSSGAANMGNPGSGVLYAVSKGGLNSFGIGLSQELAGEGIRVNTVSPGLTKTDMPPKDSFAQREKGIPMGRAGTAEEIARGIVWLLSDEASYVAGANLRISGGRP